MVHCSDQACPLLLELMLHSTAEEVRRARGRAVGELARIGWPLEACGTVELVMGEALNNVVEHAYRDRPDGEILLRLCASPGCAELRIEDHGIAMPELRLPEGREADLSVEREDLPEGGFGWLLIHRLSDRVGYLHEDGCNRLDICITCDPAARGPECRG